MPRIASPALSLFLLLGLLLMTGCARQGYQNPALSTTTQCASLWTEFQFAVTREGFFDAQDWPLPAYPFLRVSRNASYVARLGLSSQQQREWLLQAYERGRIARMIENSQLSEPLALDALESCLRKALPQLIDDQAFWDYVRATPRPDVYRSNLQRMGVYPLFQPLVSWRLNQEHAAYREMFGDYQATHPWQRYLLGERPARASVREILQPDSHRDSLGLPRFSQAEETALLAYFSPVIEQEQGQPEDRIGRPVYRNGGWQVSFRPRLYTLITTTRWEGEWVPQLVYCWWYAARPADSVLDSQSGDLDGRFWRVTLGWDGQVLFYDSVRANGFDPMWFPARADIRFEGQPTGEESLMVLPLNGPAPALHEAAPEQRAVLRLSSESHQLVGVDFETVPQIQPALNYSLVPYLSLRQQPAGERMMFNSEGIVPETERVQRFWLWAMGVPSAGSMRQWGNLPVALTSRRHYDDPDLFERLFYQDYQQE